MAVTVENSLEYANQIARPPVTMESNTVYGKLRLYNFHFTQGAAAGDATSTQRLIKLPAGKVRLIGPLSYVIPSAFGAARVLDIGWEAYRDKLGVAVAASANGVNDDIDVSAAVLARLGVTAAGVPKLADGTKLFESSAGVVLFSTVAGGTIPAGATLQGVLTIAVE